MFRVMKETTSSSQQFMGLKRQVGELCNASSVVSMHGHRRLNVLVTEQKTVVLITSLNASDISVDAKSPREDYFRDYIEYAMTGKLETGAILMLKQTVILRFVGDD